jgi:RimJ/RimL family protein N-acetyltransferase
MVSRGRLYEPARDAGVIALRGEEWVSVATYRVEGNDCEITLLDSVVERRGGGTAVIAAIADECRRRGLSRLWLITTNDNVDALGFYQRRGFVLAALHRDAIAESRRLKPEIPLVASNGIPIRDEVELELPRVGWASVGRGTSRGCRERSSRPRRPGSRSRSRS